MIEINNLTKIYNTKRKNKVTALSNINLKIGNKGLIFIVGKSGSGKSTLLNLLGGLDDITSGEIIINGKNISKFNEQELDSYRNTYIGFVFQEFNLLEEYNVQQNIELASELQNETPSKEYILKLLKLLDIENLENRNINELSGGQKQRVAIARAIIKNPQIILADEPTGNLDTKSSTQIFDILKVISQSRLVIVISHDILSAQKYADRIIKIEDGKLIEDTKFQEEKEITNKFKLKKSKLPFSYSFKMALNRLKLKPLRLTLTILLITFSFIFMSVTSNLALFKKENLIIKTMKDNNDYVVRLFNCDYGYGRSPKCLIKLNDEDISYLNSINKVKLNKEYTLYDNNEQINFEFGKKDNNFQLSTPYNIRFIEIEDDKIVGQVIGRLPQSNNEIVVHKFFADYIIKYGIKLSNGEIYIPKDYNDIIQSNKQLKLGDNKVIIVGIVDDDNSLFMDILNGKSSDKKIINYFHSNYESLSSDIYVKGFTKTAKLNSSEESLINNLYLEVFDKIQNSNIKELNNEIEIITKDGVKSVDELSKNEIIISVNTLRELQENFESEFLNYMKNNNMNYEEALEKFTLNYLNKNNIENRAKIVYLSLDDEDENIDVQIVGISMDDNNYISKKYIDELNSETRRIYGVRIYENDNNNLSQLFSKLEFLNNEDTENKLSGMHYSYNMRINDYNEAVILMTNIYKIAFIYIIIISLIFVIFAFLLFSNFITISINNCKKEIGILRSLGAKVKDVVKIFTYESLIIGFISYILSIIGWSISTNLLNKFIFKNYLFNFSGIIMNPLIIVISLIFSSLVAILISVSSSSKIAKIKPIEAILNK